MSTVEPGEVGLLSPAQKREWLARALRQKAGAQVTTAPLSHGEKALWFLHQSAPESPAYHVAFSARIRSVVDVDALRRALQGLLDRHAVLRSVFKRRAGQVLREIAGHREVGFELMDGAGLDAQELHARVREAYRRPFDLERGPLLRAHLFTCAADDHVLLLTVHHIVYDGWSLWINLDELKQLYAAEVSGQPAGLLPVGTSYSSYVRRQAQMLRGPEGEALWRFWKDELGHGVPVLDLPADRPRPPVQTHDGASHRFWLEPATAQRLKALSQAEGVTPFMLLLAVFQVLLKRYSGQDQIVVGSPTSGRTAPDVDDVVGYFVNPVVLKADLSGEPPFRAFLQQVRETVLRALAHQDYPFPLLVERLQPARDPSYSPLFQVSFVFQKAQRAGGTLDLLARAQEAAGPYPWGGLALEYYDLPQQEGQFDLELEMLEVGRAFLGMFKYNARLFDAATVQRMEAHFRGLLEGVLADPTQTVGRLPLLSREERGRLLAAAGPAALPAPADRPVHRRFEQQAAARPGAIAASWEGRHLTYAELDAQANRLAHRLRALGVGPEVLVGLFVERSLDMIVGILGILKAGGAYLPLDPSSPKDRLAFIVEDSAVPVIVTQQALATDLPGRAAAVCLDAPGALAGQGADDPAVEVAADNLAYVIYTSGSTGKPKGVEVTHRNLERLFTATEEWYRFGAHDVWTVFHSVAFDFSVWEIWGALIYGGRVVVVPYGVSRSPREFLELLAAEGVTVLNQTPSAFGQLMQAEAREAPPRPLALRLVIFGGEALDVQALAPWFERHGDVSPRLVNMYGITETTVHVTYRPLSRADAASSRSVIGVPIPDVSVHLLDAHLEPVPVGVIGEIYVGGGGVARRYLHRPELSAERFVRDPFSARPEARLYRSGDLARRLPDGDVEYVGRIDNQVKIRGFRIELAEIEVALGEHPDLARAVVTLQEDRGGDKRLVAYLVGRPGRKVAPAELRHFLADKLPAYMVPAGFVVVDELPLTGNGKIDYRALPAPDAILREAGPAFVPPRDAVEQRLAQLWEGVLSVRPVGVRDNFFELGGHSLLAVHLMADVERDFGTRLPLASLFGNPTIEQLGERLRNQTSDVVFSPLVPIQTAGDDTPFFCVAGGGGSVFYFYALAQQMGRKRPFYGLQAIGLDGECEPLTQVEDIAARYLESVQARQPHGPYLLGGHCFGGLVAFELARQLRRRGEEVALVALIDSPAPRPAAEDFAVGEEEDESVWLGRLGAIMAEAVQKDLGVDPAALGGLDFEAQLAYFREKLQAAALLPPGAGTAQVRGLLRVFMANTRARYAPGALSPVPVTLFRATQPHPHFNYPAPEDAGALEVSTLGWHRLVSGTVSVHEVPGNHVTMLTEPHVATLAARLDEALGGACQAPAASPARAGAWDERPFGQGAKAGPVDS
jgi:amino acid adenylation domain-containing protein